MKKRMKILALSMAVAMTCTCMPVNASTGNDIPYSSAFSFTGWMSDLWNRITGNDDKKEETSSDSTPVELQVIESEDTGEILYRRDEDYRWNEKLHCFEEE